MRITIVLACALSASQLVGQEVRILDGTLTLGAVFDPLRARTVAIGADGETREFDGAVWRMAPQARIPHVTEAHLVFDAVSGRSLLCSTDRTSLNFHYHDGVRWQPVQSAVSPPFRWRFSCAYDLQRDELLLFGGSNNFGELNDTWAFDGTNWSQRFPSSSPPVRGRASMAHDILRGRTVLFGGLASQPLQDTWEWDGITWTNVVTAAAPPARWGAGMAYDAPRQRMVLHGGATSASNYPQPDDTWLFDGTTWSNASVTPRPPSRLFPTLFFNASIAEVELLGGEFGAPKLADEWHWNGVRWQQRVLAPDPGLRESSVTADPNGDRLVLYKPGATMSETWTFDGFAWQQVAAGPPPRVGAAFCAGPTDAFLFGGGGPGNGPVFNELWRWNGASWSQVVVPSPPPRGGAAMAFDVARNELVLFGGLGATNQVLGDTWVFDGALWTQRAPAVSPPARTKHGMAYDIVGAETLLFGGITTWTADDTWRWNGSNWALVPVPFPRPLVAQPSLAFDVERGRVTLTGNVNNHELGAWYFDGSTWIPITPLSVPLDAESQAVGWPYRGSTMIVDYDSVLSLRAGPADVEHYGAACSASSPDLVPNEWPRIGSATFGLDVVTRPSNSLVAVAASLQSAGTPLGPCTLLVAPGLGVFFPSTVTSALSALSLPLPNDAAFVGLDLFFQAAALDASANGGFTLSRGLRISLGY